MGKSSLPPGFRFNPTDVELVQYYLKRKIMGKKFHVKVITEVDIYKWAPWDLPDKSCWRSGDLKWYFFTPIQKKYASGGRMNRATNCGYWKTTGKDRSVIYNTAVVGWIKTLIFHTGRAPRGERTNWVLHEYRLDEQNLVGMDVHQDSYVLSIIFQKDGIGPRNNKQYGAPFKEEDWTDDDDDETDVILHANLPDPVIANRPDPVIANMHEPDLVLTKMPDPQLVSANMADQTHVNSDLTEHDLAFGNMPDPCLDYLNTSQSDIVYANTSQPDLDHANMPEPSLVMPSSCNVSLSSHGSCVSDILSPSNNVVQSVSKIYVTREESHLSTDDDILLLLECFTEEKTSLIGKNKEHHNLVYSGDATPIGDIYRDLGGLSKDGYTFPSGQYSRFTPDQMPPGENEPFLELLDLDKPLDGNNSLLSQQRKEFSPTSTFLGGTPYDDSFISWEGDI